MTKRREFINKSALGSEDTLLVRPYRKPYVVPDKV